MLVGRSGQIRVSSGSSNICSTVSALYWPLGMSYTGALASQASGSGDDSFDESEGTDLQQINKQKLSQQSANRLLMHSHLIT